MCLILFAYESDPAYRLIVAGNRDELYERPTAPAHFWSDAPNVLAGRDLEKMGTWMGVTKQGRFAALTNYRNPHEETTNKRTRGELVSRFLTGQEAPVAYLQRVQESRLHYPGFNLLVGDGKSLYYYSNVENEIQRLEPGVYGLSNHLLDTPWPKVEKGKAGLSECLRSHPAMTECLLQTLRCNDPAPDEQLPNTGVTLEWERKLSPLFIETEGYGTRTSTVMFMTDQHISMTERAYVGLQQTDAQFFFQIEKEV